MIFEFQPARPGERIDWVRSEGCFPWLDRMQGCPVDERYHREADVLSHTRMTCDALVEDPAYWHLDPPDRDIAFASALLHEIARPVTTHPDGDGRWRSLHHASVGTVMARRVLYEMAVPFRARESICSVIRHHLKPFFAIGHPRPKRLALELAVTTRLDLLTLVARADARGRDCDGARSLLDGIELFHEFCAEEGLVSGEPPFANAHSRFVFFRNPGSSEPYVAHHEPHCQVTLLSGLPGSGKDHWISRRAADLSVISLDDIRRSLRIKPSDGQGPVLAAGFARAKEHLRRREAFVWNATNLTRQLRSQLIDVVAAYHGHVTIVYVEVPLERLRRQNAHRDHPVRENILEQMMKRWEVPDLTEAHEVEYVVE